MLEAIVAQQVFFYFVGAAVAIGIAAKVIAGISLKRLVRASSNMSKSNHGLMRLVKAKFEHACMVSDKVQNVQAFVEKYVYEHRVFGIRLHSWRQMEKTSIWLCAFFSAAGAALAYYVEGIGQELYQYGILGGSGVVILFLLNLVSDEKYQLNVIKVYMVDFLENTYAHRYAKNNQREIQVTVQRTPDEEGQALEEALEEVRQEKSKQEIVRRERKLEEQAKQEEPRKDKPDRDTLPQIEPLDREINEPIQEPGLTPPLDPEPTVIPIPIEEPAPLLNQSVQAASSPFVQASGNWSKQSDQGNQATQERKGYKDEAEEQQESDSRREARIREILEEFLA